MDGQVGQKGIIVPKNVHFSLAAKQFTEEETPQLPLILFNSIHHIHLEVPANGSTP